MLTLIKDVIATEPNCTTRRSILTYSTLCGLRNSFYV